MRKKSSKGINELTTLGKKKGYARIFDNDENTWKYKKIFMPRKLRGEQIVWNPKRESWDVITKNKDFLKKGPCKFVKNILKYQGFDYPSRQLLIYNNRHSKPNRELDF